MVSCAREMMFNDILIAPSNSQLIFNIWSLFSESHNKSQRNNQQNKKQNEPKWQET